jgi:hypothetical protein
MKKHYQKKIIKSKLGKEQLEKFKHSRKKIPTLKVEIGELILYNSNRNPKSKTNVLEDKLAIVISVDDIEKKGLIEIMLLGEIETKKVNVFLCRKK